VFGKKLKEGGLIKRWPENLIKEGWKSCYYNELIKNSIKEKE
jgi:hypothetical protein